MNRPSRLKFGAYSAALLLLVVSILPADAKLRLTAKKKTPAPAPQKTQAKKKTPTNSPPTRSRRAPARRSRATVNAWYVSSYGDPTAGDDYAGEDLAVREAAIEALGSLNGTVVVADPNSGRVLSMVNQKLALSPGEQPCSTIKLPVALAALNEGLITRSTPMQLNRRLSMNLTEALARSNNPFFERLGERMGFAKVTRYANEYGFGELAGYRIEGEQPGLFPVLPPSFGGIKRMSSFGQDIYVTPLQLAAFVSAVGNGGTLYYLQYPRTPQDLENFKPLVKRRWSVPHLLGDLKEGMMAAVDYGTGRRAQHPFGVVYGKTGTCNHEGAHLGWFASYEGYDQARVSVVVLLRGGRIVNGAFAAEVAGKVYRGLHQRNYFAQNGRLASSSEIAAGGQQ